MKTLARVSLGLFVAAGALAGAVLLGLEGAAPVAWVAALILLLAWLLAPASPGGSARFAALLAPDPRQPWSAELSVTAA